MNPILQGPGFLLQPGSNISSLRKSLGKVEQRNCPTLHLKPLWGKWPTHQPGSPHEQSEEGSPVSSQPWIPLPQAFLVLLSAGKGPVKVLCKSIRFSQKNKPLRQSLFFEYQLNVVFLSLCFHSPFYSPLLYITYHFVFLYTCLMSTPSLESSRKAKIAFYFCLYSQVLVR